MHNVVTTSLDTSEFPAMMTPSEAAKLIRLSTDRLAALRVEGGGPVFIKAGRTVLYARADIEAWLKTCARRSTSDKPAIAA